MKYGNINIRAEGIYCYIKDRNVFEEVMLYNASIVVKPKSQSIIWQQAVIECLDMTIREGIMRYVGVFTFYLRISTALKKLRTHSVQEVMENERVEIRVDTRIKTDILIKNNRPDIFIYDKKDN
ncbi:hypothetical protein TCON_2771 [Astathelohania contejeani]|uniref:Uncharacterized protein n=1 Tax=Astathelohania contejeani TaxID=164912 RepID=A0ABQ7HV22_9MICR|nr:hypothetical protein TCON_2771 [Thelohania contejeani]